MIIKTRDNKIWLHGRMWSGDDIYFEHEFSQIENIFDTIEVHVHTIGGDVFAGNYIKSRLKLAKPTIDMQIDGAAFSMGAFLLPAADTRSIVSNGFIMIHQAQGTTQGTAKEHRSTADLLDDMNENFIDDLVTITGKSRVKVLKWFDGDNYFNAKKALKEGLVDKIVDPVIDISIDEKQALRNPELFGQFEALLVQKQNENNFKSKTTKMKSAIIAKYGLTGVTDASSDTAVFEALEKHFNSQNKGTDYEALKKEHNTLKESVKEEIDKKIEALLKPLQGKVDQVKLDAYKGIGEKSGVVALEIALEGVQGRPDISKMIIGKKGGEGNIDVKAGWDWDKYQKEDPRGLEKLAAANPEAFGDLYEVKFGKKFEA